VPCPGAFLFNWSWVGPENVYMYFNSLGDSNVKSGLRTTTLERGRGQSQGSYMDFVLKIELSH
jgi:hypothetical protein